MPNTTVWEPVGAAEFAVLDNRNFPAVAVLTVQPLASPRLVGCEANVEDELEKPVGVEHAPEAVVQMTASADLITVADGTVKLKVYVVVAADEAALEVLRVSFRAVIWAALAGAGINNNKVLIITDTA